MHSILIRHDAHVFTFPFQLGASLGQLPFHLHAHRLLLPARALLLGQLHLQPACLLLVTLAELIDIFFPEPILFLHPCELLRHVRLPALHRHQPAEGRDSKRLWLKMISQWDDKAVQYCSSSTGTVFGNWHVLCICSCVCLCVCVIQSLKHGWQL